MTDILAPSHSQIDDPFQHLWQDPELELGLDPYSKEAEARRNKRVKEDDGMELVEMSVTTNPVAIDVQDKRHYEAPFLIQCVRSAI